MNADLPPTIPHAAEAAARRFGEAPAIVEAGEAWSFVTLWRHARTAAAAFIAAGTRHGDRIAIWAPNRRDWIVATLGAQIAGAAIVPLNTRLKGNEAGDILRRAKLNQHHRISREQLSVREHMSIVLRRLAGKRFVEFHELFEASRGVPVLVVTFIAMLELSREHLLEITQAEAFAPIYVRLAYRAA